MKMVQTRPLSLLICLFTLLEFFKGERGKAVYFFKSGDSVQQKHNN